MELLLLLGWNFPFLNLYTTQKNYNFMQITDKNTELFSNGRIFKSQNKPTSSKQDDSIMFFLTPSQHLSRNRFFTFLIFSIASVLRVILQT